MLFACFLKEYIPLCWPRSSFGKVYIYLCWIGGECLNKLANVALFTSNITIKLMCYSNKSREPNGPGMNVLGVILCKNLLGTKCEFSLKNNVISWLERPFSRICIRALIMLMIIVRFAPNFLVSSPILWLRICSLLG